MATVLILGATSDIAQAVARRFAEASYDLQLAARDPAQLEILASDLRVRYQVRVQSLAFDATQFDTHSEFYRQLEPSPAVVITVFGYLGDQAKGQKDWTEAQAILDTNYSGAVSILNVVAEDFAQKSAGTIVGISSVAGDRGRGSNYLYGSAKAGFTAYLSGLRNRMQPHGVSVITVKPGFVDTSMTADLDLPPLLTAKPSAVAEDIFQAVRSEKDVVYSKWFWRPIMAVITLLPEGVFKRMKL
ncbi:MAG: SDR family oxidoreductase [Tunicatimonas sp.]